MGGQISPLCYPSAMPVSAAQHHHVTLLRELAHGPVAGAEYGQFSEPGAGLLPTLRRLSAAQASLRPAPTRPSVGMLASHLTQMLSYSAGGLRGSVEFPDFAAPWRLAALNEAAWGLVQDDLRGAFGALEVALLFDLDEAGEQAAASGLTHVAYHCGALRERSLTLLARGD